MELTKEYFDQQLHKFATKDDINAQTKELEAKFATKDDINAQTKELEVKFATKDDITSMESRMETKFSSKEDFEYLKVKISQVEDKVDGLHIKLDRIATRDEEDIKAVIKVQASHERRINALEKEINS